MRKILTAALLLAAAGPGAAAAAPEPPNPPRSAPLELPGALRAARAGGDWIVGARPGGAAAGLARRAGARLLMGGSGIYRVPTGAARPFAHELRRAGLLSFAEPDSRLPRRTGFPSDPRTPDQWWIPAVVDGSLTPPPVTSHSALLAIDDSQVARNHNELRGHVKTTSSKHVSDEHGTAVAAVASASNNGKGIVGVWPGMRVLDSVNTLTCSSVVEAVSRARRAGAAVINMSYAFPATQCFAHEIATNLAFGSGRVLVAAAGNDFDQGNEPLSPGVDPHILTVSAVDRKRQSAFFSSENGAIDVAAPGVDVLTAVPKKFDDDGARNGYASVAGTSVSAPIVAAASAWIAQRRRTLANDQVVEAIRRSATDLGPRGWDRAFGYGLLDLRRALGQRVPRHDPGEPNDDVEWVDGTFFKRDKPVWQPGTGRRTINARIDRLEDPADVYRVRVKAHQRVRFELTPRYGDPDLELYRGSARTIYSKRGRIARSTRSGGAAERLNWKNRSDRAATIYVDTYVSPDTRQLNAAYRLVISGT